jgi:hypothetical protein
VTADRAGGPDLAVVVPLLYRAGFQRFSFSAEVWSRDVPPHQEGDPAPEAYDWTMLSGTVVAGPDGRYRADLVDEEGEPERDAGEWDELPFAGLFRPDWLLSGADLEITGESDYAGRPAYTVTGHPRLAASDRDRELTGEVTAHVDAELGILLQYERTSPFRGTKSAGFTSLAVSSAAGPPAGAPPSLSDEQVNLLHRTSLGPQRFSAELREWADPGAVNRLSAVELIPGPVAGVIGRLLEHADDQPAIDLAGRLRVAMPGSYRIDVSGDPGRRPASASCDGHQFWQVYPDRVVVRPAAAPPRGISSIIDPAWLLSGYRLSVGGSAEYDGRPSLRLAAEPISRLDRPMTKGPLSGRLLAADRIEADIDIELGIIVRQAWSIHGSHVFSTEMAGVTANVDPAAFTITPAPGVRVVSGGPPAWLAGSPGEIAWGAAKGAARVAAELGIRWMKRYQP